MRPEEEGFFLVRVVNAGDVRGSADGIAVVVFLVWRNGRLEVFRGIESVVAHELIDVAVELGGTGLGFNFHRAGAIAAVLRAVVGSEHFELGDRLQAGIHVQGDVAAVVHVVAAVEFPVVVLGTTAVDAERDIAVNANCAFVLSRLIADAGCERDKLGKVPAVQLKLCDLLSGDCPAQIGRLSLHLGDVCTFDRDFSSSGSDLHGYIIARFLAYAQDHAPYFVLLEARRCDRNIDRPRWQSSNEVITAIVGGGGPIYAPIRTAHRNLCFGDSCAAGVGNCSSDRRGVLSESSGRDQDRQ